MTAINGTTSGTTTAQQRAAIAVPAAAKTATSESASTNTTQAAGYPVVVALSKKAQAFATSLLSKTTSPTEDLLKDRRDAFTSKFAGVLKKVGVPDGEDVSLTLDRSGAVTSDSPYRKKIEQYFKDDPDAAKELKQIADLSAMVATQKALEAKKNEQAAAINDKERGQADTRFLQRSTTIQNLSSRISFAGGKITTGADDYVAAMTPATTPAEAATRASAVDRLKTMM